MPLLRDTEKYICARRVSLENKDPSVITPAMNAIFFRWDVSKFLVARFLLTSRLLDPSAIAELLVNMAAVHHLGFFKSQFYWLVA